MQLGWRASRHDSLKLANYTRIEYAHLLLLSDFFSIRCLATLDFGGGVEQPFGCLIIQNRQAMQSMRRLMDWTLEDNMVDGLFFCATLTRHRGRHTPFVQT